LTKIKLTEFFKKFKLSIFFKLFLVLLGTGFLVFLIIGIFLRTQTNPRVHDVIRKNMENYIHYLVQDIGNPPDTLRAREIAKSYDFQIAYLSDKFNWSTGKITELKRGLIRRHRTGSLTPRWLGYQLFEYHHPDGSQFIFGINHATFFDNHEKRVILLFLCLGLTFLISYWAIQRILKPIKWLKQGVLQVSQANFNHYIPVKSEDELGELSRSFNNMTRRIQEMFHARDQLLLDVSHELRSPITRMKVALEFFPEAKDRQSIHEDLNEMEQMITEILETERLKGGHGKLALEPSDIVNVIQQVADNYQDQSPGIKFIRSPSINKLSIDMERIKIVLKNIFENALKYSQPDSHPIEVTVSEMEQMVIIEIQDDGIGVSAEHLPYLFEPFYRVDKSRSKKTGGYGLGLSLCKKIMEAHGGSIEMVTRKPRGMIVRLIFPKLVESAKHNESSPCNKSDYPPEISQL